MPTAISHTYKFRFAILKNCFPVKSVISEARYRSAKLPDSLFAGHSNAFAIVVYVYGADKKYVIDIEIQNRWNDEFAQRTVFYWAKMYTENLQKGEVYTKLPKCITINLVGEGFKLNALLHSEYRVLEKQLYTELSDELEIHFLNLAKAKEKRTVKAEPNEKAQRLVNWLKFIETDDKEVRAMLADNSPVMEQANETVDVMLQDPKERWLYENRMKYEHDKASWEHFGYTKGIEKGARQKALETAAALKRLGVEFDTIAAGTGLSREEVEKL